MTLTRREKNVLMFAVGAAVLLSLVKIEFINKYELLWQLLIVIPLVIYILKDPERGNNNG